MYENIDDFKTFLEKYKVFRELPEQYKSIKFCKLYYKIYSYTLSIPKEKIVISHIVKRNNYIQYLFSYINCFIEAKDFYNWKNRIYKLITEKIGSDSYEHFKLLYRSKTKEKFNETQEKKKVTCMKNYNVERPTQSKEIQDRIKATCLEKYGKKYYTQTEEMKEKSKATCLERYNKEYAQQSKEIQDRIKTTNLEKYGKEYYTQTEEMKEKSKAACMKNLGVEYPLQSLEIQEKYKATCLEIYGVKNPGGLADKSGAHSKSGDKICQAIDNALGNPEDSKYATKNGEFYLKAVNNTIRKYDYCIPSLAIIVEVDDPYWHALDKEDNELIKFPGNRIVLAKDIHKRDKEKEELAIKAGYKVFHIRDDEYKKDSKGTINKLLEEIRMYLDIFQIHQVA